MGEKLASVTLSESTSDEAASEEMERMDACSAEDDRRDQNTHSLLEAWKYLMRSRPAPGTAASEEPKSAVEEDATGSAENVAVESEAAAQAEDSQVDAATSAALV